jgi:hypothetical protein
VLKLNLKTKSVINLHSVPWLKKLNWVLGVMVFVQVVVFTRQRILTSELRAEIEKLTNVQEELESKKQRFKEISADSVALAAAVNARNKWVEDRASTPDKILVKFEQRRLRGIQFKSFSASRTGGTLKLYTGDTEKTTQLLNSVFAGLSGRMTVEEQSQGKALINYTWTR